MCLSYWLIDGCFHYSHCHFRFLGHGKTTAQPFAPVVCLVKAAVCCTRDCFVLFCCHCAEPVILAVQRPPSWSGICVAVYIYLLPRRIVFHSFSRLLKCCSPVCSWSAIWTVTWAYSEGAAKLSVSQPTDWLAHWQRCVPPLHSYGTGGHFCTVCSFTRDTMAVWVGKYPGMGGLCLLFVALPEIEKSVD